MELTREDENTLKDMLENAILNKKPADYVPHHNGDWFCVDSTTGNIAWNWRTRAYPLGVILQKEDPQLHAMFISRSNYHTLFGKIVTSVLNRASVRKYRQAFVNRNIAIVRQNLTERLARIDRDLAYLQQQRDDLVEQLKTYGG